MRNSEIFVTVDAVVYTDEIHRKILLIRRAKEPFAGLWALPGGFVDVDEDLSVAASRELTEETGIEATPMGQIGAFGHPGRDPRQRTVSVAYLFKVPATTEVLGADDAAEARWFPEAELPSLAFDHAEIVEHSKTFTL